MDTTHVNRLLQDVPSRPLQNATALHLAEYGLCTIEDWLYQQSKDMSRHLADGSDWATLETKARKAQPSAKWFRRFLIERFDNTVYLQNEGYALDSLPLVLGFETLPTLDELQDAFADARRREGAEGEMWLTFDADAAAMVPELFCAPAPARERASLRRFLPGSASRRSERTRTARPLRRLPVAAAA
jgi:hypothetical protein